MCRNGGGEHYCKNGATENIFHQEVKIRFIELLTVELASIIEQTWLAVTGFVMISVKPLFIRLEIDSPSFGSIRPMTVVCLDCNGSCKQRSNSGYSGLAKFSSTKISRQSELESISGDDRMELTFRTCISFALRYLSTMELLPGTFL